MSAKTDMEAKDMYYEALEVRQALACSRVVSLCCHRPLSARGLLTPLPQRVGQKNDKTVSSPVTLHIASHDSS